MLVPVRNIGKYITARYIGILAALLMLALMGLVSLHWSSGNLRHQIKDADYIFQHKYLVQEIALITHAMMGEKDSKSYSNYKKQLVTSLNNFENIVAYLDDAHIKKNTFQKDMHENDLLHVNSYNVLARKYAAHVKLLLEKNRILKADSDFKAIQFLANELLKDRFEDALTKHSKELSEAISHVENIQFLFFIIMCLIAVVSGVFIMRPLICHLVGFQERFLVKYRNLYRLKKNAEQSSRRKSEFLTEMSHAIRTPLNGIIGTLDLFRMGRISNEQKDYISTINKSSHSLLGLINNIIDYSRFESGSFTLEATQFDLKSVVSQVVSSYQGLAEDKALEIIVQFDDQIDAQLVGDKYRVEQVLMNLVGNAIQYTEEGYVLVNVARRDQKKTRMCLLVEVSDTGIGIAEKDSEHVFNKFGSRKAGDTHKGEGVGLGLTLSKKIIDMMGGKIGFVSEALRGSSFWFELTLPIGKAIGFDAEKDFNISGARVLVVDDIRANREIVTKFSQHAGLDVVAVECAEDAIAEMQLAARDNTPFDVAVIDYNMPGMNGVELIQMMAENKNMRRVMPILASSAHAKEDINTLKSAGVRGYLIKPFYAENVLSMISVLMQSRQSKNQLPLLTPAIVDEMMRNMDDNDRVLLTSSKKVIDVGFSGNKVLLVEDNEINRIVIGKMIEQFGCEVEMAEDGEEGLKKMKAGKYDLVLTDCMMPGIDGYEMTRRFRRSEGEKKDHQIIVALTAGALPGDREKCLDAGMDNYLSKPVNIEELRNVLEKYLG